MNSPIFSVIIPIHNKFPHVTKSIRSVLKQTFSEFELILIDDACTDDSLLEIQKINDPRMRILRRSTPGPGGYAARNLGVKFASAEWVAFLDADDEWLPNHLENLWGLSKRYPEADMISCGWYIANAGIFRVNPYSKGNNGERLLAPRDYLAIHARGYDLINTNAVAVRRERLCEAGGFPEYSESCKRAGDGQTWLRVVLTGALTAWRSEPSSIYNQDAVNMVTKKKKYDITENGLITYISDCLQNGSYPEYTTYLRRYRNLRVLSAMFQDVGSGEVGIRHVQRAIRYFCWDARVAAIIVAYLSPRLGCSLFRMKDRSQRG